MNKDCLLFIVIGLCNILNGCGSASPDMLRNNHAAKDVIYTQGEASRFSIILYDKLLNSNLNLNISSPVKSEDKYYIYIYGANLRIGIILIDIESVDINKIKASIYLYNNIFSSEFREVKSIINSIQTSSPQ